MTHNLAINENLYQLEQVLLAKISKIRQKIDRNQRHIESEARKLNELNAQEQHKFSEQVKDLATKLKKFLTLVNEATQESSLNEGILDLLFAIRSDVISQLDPSILIFMGHSDPGGCSAQNAADPTDTEPNPEKSNIDDDHDDDNYKAKSIDPEKTEEEKREHERYIKYMRDYERRQRLRDPFSQESIDALKQSTEAPDIRKLYLHLSKQIHPDLAVNTDDAARRTALMQRLSTAYRSGDFAAMLAIQESLDIESFTASAEDSITEERIASLRSTIEHLEAQAKILERHKRRMARSKGGKFLRVNRTLGDDAFNETHAPLVAMNSMLGEVITATVQGIDGELSQEDLYVILENALFLNGGAVALAVLSTE